MMDEARTTWPRRFPVYLFGGLALALACGGLMVRAWVQFAPPLQRFYLRTYATQTLLGSLPKFGTKPTVKPYPMVFAGSQLATDALLAENPGRLSLKLMTFEPHTFQTWLRVRIYGGKTLDELLIWPLVGTGVCVLLFGGFGAALDRSRNSEARNGRLIRGPRIISRWQFNRATKGDGLRLRLQNPRNLFEWLKPGKTGRDILIRRDMEASHIEVEGVTGAGKSTVFRQFLHQIAERGETAIIFDPHLEYITEFYDPKRRDIVLNPLDNRCPYWAIECETNSEAEAASIALGLWPDEPNQQPFFKKHPRAIFAYLISRFSAWNNPSDPATCQTLGRWLSNPRTEVTPRLVGTRHAVSTDANAKDQSAGLWATLGEVATPLLMMPTAAENRPSWTVREWGKQRRGWIFITSTPNTLDALRPLQSLWLDMLILKLQSPEQHEGQKRVWTMLDEVRLLNRLPQLEMALTGQRKADCPIVIGFQGMSQLIKIYGQQDAETIVSQPFTKVLLRTSDERAAQHLSNTIGNVEIERVNESMPAHWFGGSHSRHSFSSQRVVSPLVMPSEIQSFDNLNGYFVQPGKAVNITVARQQKVTRAEALIERIIPPGKLPAIESETNRNVDTTPQTVETVSISPVW